MAAGIVEARPEIVREDNSLKICPPSPWESDLMDQNTGRARYQSLDGSTGVVRLSVAKILAEKLYLG